jgi:predicted cobalt transporter CbtA
VERKLVLRGVLSGTLAGLLAFVFARIFAEPQIQKAIDYENARDAAQAALDKAARLVPEAADHEVFSRAIQADVGIGVGLVLFGAAMGGLFAVVYAICLGRVGRLGPRSIAMLVAGGGFLGIYLIPFLKYPANPPSIGHAETIRQRGGLYLLMVFCSLVGLMAAIWLGQRLRARFGNWTASLIAGAAFVVVIGTVMALLPSFGELSYNRQHFGSFGSETPEPLRDSSGAIVFPGFPADLLFSFRLYSVAMQLILWAAIGLAFAPMADRLLGQGTTRQVDAFADPSTAP